MVTASSRYHRRAYVCCCILAGDEDCGGEATRMPVVGLTMGMALRARMADGWWIFVDDDACDGW